MLCNATIYKPSGHLLHSYFSNGPVKIVHLLTKNGEFPYLCGCLPGRILRIFHGQAGVPRALAMDDSRSPDLTEGIVEQSIGLTDLEDMSLPTDADGSHIFSCNQLNIPYIYIQIYSKYINISKYIPNLPRPSFFCPIFTLPPCGPRPG